MKSAGTNGWMGISASRFTDSQLLCQEIWRQLGNHLAEMGGFLQVDLPTFSNFKAHLEQIGRKSASHNRGCFSDSRFTHCQLICQQIWRQSENLLAEMGVYFCWQIYGLLVILPAHLEDTVRKSAGRKSQMGMSASTSTDSQLICWQI